jgi:hypothetical protein
MKTILDTYIIKITEPNNTNKLRQVNNQTSFFT